MRAVRELGRRVKQRRVRAGLSQRALASRVGKSHGWVSNLEHGVMQRPMAEDLTALASILGDEPADYLRLAGRVSLAAEDVIPAAPGLPPEALAAIEGAVERAMERFGDRLVQRLGELLADRQDDARSGRLPGRSRPRSRS